MYSVTQSVTSRFFTLGNTFKAAVVAASMTAAASIPAAALDRPHDRPLAGINVSGGAYNPTGTRLDVDYRYARPQELDYFIEKGFRIFRIPFLASRLLEGPIGNARINARDQERLEALIDYLASKNCGVILDMHDYGVDRHGKVIGSTQISIDGFANDWATLTKRWKHKWNVSFGLMNEPHVQSPKVWVKAANAAIAAIRANGVKQLVLVPGSAWSSASTWHSSGNAVALLDVRDPGNHYMIEVHHYLDAKSSGKSTDVLDDASERRLTPVTDWARKNGKKLFLGEFGWSDTAEANEEGRDMLLHLDRNRDVWMAWAAWAAGRWLGSYSFSLEPAPDGTEAGQMAILEEFIPNKLAQQ